MTHKERILALLQRQGSATNRELNALGIFRYAARIAELRAAGHNITTARVANGLYRFTYHPPNGAPQQ